MTPRRLETRVPTEPSVRFYKVVALSFLFITIVLLAVVVFMSSKRATITITTKDTPIDVRLAVMLSDTTDAEHLAGSATTTDFVVSDIFSPTGEEEVSGTATGEMVIYNDSARPQPLVATTRFLTSDGTLFRLQDGVTVPANGTITAAVYADEEGADGNVEPQSWTIPGLNEARQQEVYGQSENAMTGGIRTIGILSQDDLDQALRVLEERALGQAAEQLSPLDGEEMELLIVDSSVSADQELGTELSEFTATATVTVLSVYYDPIDARTMADTAIAKRAVGGAETVVPGSEVPTVAIDSYDASNGEVNISVFQSGLASLNPESEELRRSVFFGKTRDEIRRYVLSLDHVHGVEIDFSPAWMQTVPHVKEHVNVVIKSI